MQMQMQEGQNSGAAVVIGIMYVIENLTKCVSHLPNPSVPFLGIAFKARKTSTSPGNHVNQEIAKCCYESRLYYTTLPLVALLEKKRRRKKGV